MKAYSIKNNRLFQILIIAWVILSYVPYALYFSPTIVNMPVILGLAGLIFISQSGSILDSLLKLFPFFLFIVLDFIVDILLGRSSSFVVFAYGLIQKLLLPLITISIIRHNDIGLAKTVLISIIACLFITSITTYIGCTLYPGASRALAGSLGASGETDLLVFYKRLNIGGFEFIYTLVLLCPILVFMIKEYKTKAYLKVIFVLLLVWILMVIIRSEYTMASMISFLSLALIFVKAHKRYFFLLLVFMVLLYFIASDLLMFLSTIIESDTLSSRMEDISQVIQGLDTTSAAGFTDIDSRKDLYLMAWNAFLKSPIYGTGSVIGGHSFVLNILSKYGLIGFALMVFQFIKIYQYSLKPQRKSPAYNFISFIFISQLILAILNPLVIYSFFMVIIPLFCFVVSTPKEQGSNYVK